LVKKIGSCLKYFWNHSTFI